MKTTIWLSLILLGALAGCEDSGTDDPQPNPAGSAGSDAATQAGKGGTGVAGSIGGAGSVGGAGKVGVAGSVGDAGSAGSGGIAGSAGAAGAPEDSEFANCTGELPVMQARDLSTNAEMDADWSCYATDPMPTGAVPNARYQFPWSGPMIPLLALQLFTDVKVDFFFGPSTLGEPDLSRTFDGLSQDVPLELPANLEHLSARVHAHDNIQPAFSTVEINEYGLTPLPDGTIEGFFLVRDSRTLAINLALGGSGTEDPTKAVIIAIVRDCQARPVSGALFDLVDGDTGNPVPTGTEPGMPRVSYSHLGLPSTGCEFTSNEQQISQYMLIDAPVNVVDGAKTHSYRLRLKGRKQASDAEPVVFGEREVELFAGGTTYVRLFR